MSFVLYHKKTFSDAGGGSWHYISIFNFPNFGSRERGGVVVERRTQNLEVLGSITTGVTVLCP